MTVDDAVLKARELALASRIRVRTAARTARTYEHVALVHSVKVDPDRRAVTITASEPDDKERGIAVFVAIPFSVLAEMVALMATKMETSRK